MNISTLTPTTLLTIDPSEVLEIVYKPDFIYLTDAHYADGALATQARWFVPECYSQVPTHLTRLQIVTYVGQAAYLLGAHLAGEGLLRPLTLAGYIDGMRRDRGTFRSLRLDFRRFIGKQDLVDVRIRVGRRSNGNLQIHVMNGMVVFPLFFEICNAACSGQSEGVMLL